eukprot:9517731-Alexandrium_andersonii.AAC.1
MCIRDRSLPTGGPSNPVGPPPVSTGQAPLVEVGIRDGRPTSGRSGRMALGTADRLSLIHISEPTRLALI